MVFLALGDLESAVELFSQNEPGHQVGQCNVAKADPSVGTGADFGRDAVAAAYYDLKSAAALFDVGNKV